jgi:hypothetical protein
LRDECRGLARPPSDFTMFLGCRLGRKESGAPVVALTVCTMLWGIRGQRKAAKEAYYAEGNDANAERYTNPLQNVGHLHLRSLRGWFRQRGDRFILPDRPTGNNPRVAGGLSPASPPLEMRKLFGRAHPVSGWEKLRTHGKRESQVAASGVARPPLALQPYVPHRRLRSAPRRSTCCASWCNYLPRRCPRYRLSVTNP